METNPLDFGEFIDREIELIRRVLGETPTTQRNEPANAHPAVQRLLKLEEFRSRRFALSYPDDQDLLRSIAVAALESQTWAKNLAKTPSESIWASLGAEVQSFLESRLPSAEVFDDAMAALYTWGALRDRNLNAKLIEQIGHPDIALMIDGEVTWAEVKRIHLGTKPKRVGKILTKANNQLKVGSRERSGVVFISIERDGARAAFDDSIPTDIEPFLSAGKKALSGSVLKSVAAAVFTWDDYFIHGDPPKRSFYAFRRRSIVIRHPQPRSELPLVDDQIALGGTLGFHVDWGSKPAQSRLEAIRHGAIRLTQQFRQDNEFADGVRRAHVIEAISAPTGLERVDLGGATLFLATRIVSISQRPFTLLIVGSEDLPNGTLDVISAFKLVHTDPTDSELAPKPSAVLERFIERFGKTISIGEASGLLVRGPVIVPHGVGISLVEDTPESFGVYAFMKRGETGDTFAWAFSVSKDRYHRSLHE